VIVGPDYCTIETMNTLLVLFLLLLAITTTPKLYSKEAICSGLKNIPQVDLRHELGPIRDQDSVGWCYAFGATDIVGHYLYKKHNGPSVTTKENAISASAAVFQSQYKNRIWALYSKEYQREKLINHNKKIEQLNAKVMLANLAYKTREKKLLKNHPEVNKLRLKEQRLLEALKNSKSKETFNNYIEAGKLYSAKSQFLNDDTILTNIIDDIFKQEEEIDQLYLNPPKLTSIFKDDGGHASVIFSELLDGRFCREKQVSSEGYYLETSNHDTENLLWEIDQLFTKENYKQQDILCHISTNLRSFFKEIPIKDILKIVENSPLDPIGDLVNSSCKERAWPQSKSNPKPKLVGFYPDKDNPNNIFQAVDDSLDKGLIAGINYRSEIFTYGDKELEKKLSQTDFLHFSTIVGKKFNCKTNETDYILRNSWGKDQCDINRKEYTSIDNSPQKDNISDRFQKCLITLNKLSDKNKMTSSKYHQLESVCIDERDKSLVALHKPSYQCTEDGYYIVPKSVLQKGVHSIETIEE
jgi:hypothetical protein